MTHNFSEMRSVSDHQQADTTSTTAAAIVAAAAATIVGKDTSKNEEEKKMLSIYDLHSKYEKTVILLITSFVGFLSLLDELIYIPALPVMTKDFKTTEAMGLLTISLYLFGTSVSGLVWGLLSDCYGRKPITTFGLGCLILSTIGCYLSPNIYALLVCRALQGCLVSVTVVVGQGTIADIYHPNDRGTAYGIFYAVLSFAGLCAPALGGQISYYYGWKSIFLFLTVISSLLFISYVLIIPETQQYKVICTYQRQQKITLIESDQVSRPEWRNPCSLLLNLSDFTTFSYIAVLVCGSLAANISTAIFALDLGKPPYSYPQNIVGMLFIPGATAYLLGSLIGGKVSDLVSTKQIFSLSQIPDGRIVPGLIFSLLIIVGLTTYGWTITYGTHVVVPIIGQFLIVFGQAATIPGILSYFTIKYQEHSGSISSLTTFLPLFMSSIVLTFTGQIIVVIHNGPFFTTLAVCTLLTTTVAAGIIFRKLTLSKSPETELLL